MRGAIGILAAFAVFGAASASAQPVEPYTGKTVSVIIGFGPGGGYDMWGRLIARHIGKHLPGKPNVIAQNMPGAGSFVAASHIYNAAPKDGTVFGIIARDAALGPLTGAPGARFDATKFSWLGTPTKETNVCIAYQTAAVKTVQDLFEKQLIVGDTGPGTGTRSFPKVLSEILRHEVQARRRISVVGRRVPGDGTRRGRRHLRKPRQHQEPASGLDCDRTGRRPVPGRRRAKSGIEGRSVRARLRRATMRTRRCSNFSMPGRASAGRSWRRRTCRRSG